MHMKNWPRLKLTSALLIAVLAAGCSFFKGKGNERSQGHHQLYSEPEAPAIETLPDHQRRIVLVATNDWQGNLEPRTEVARDSHHPQQILMSVGGVDIYSRYLNILRHLYPNQVTVVDAGNSLGGTLAARASGGEAILSAFQELRYDAIGLSTKDLAAGPSLKKGSMPAEKWFPALLEKITTPVLATNLIDLHTTKPVAWGPTVAQAIKVVNGVQVGFIGLMANEKLDPAIMNGLYIEPTMQALLKQVRALRLKGAEMIVVLAHGGITCGVERAEQTKLPLTKVNFNTADASVCSASSDLAKFIHALPDQMVDVVVTGGGPSKVANFINGIPVVQAFSNGTSFSRVDLIFDRLNKRVLTEETKIHQPIRLCHRFFKETQDCYTEDNSVDHRVLIPAQYLGQPIMPDELMSAWHGRWREMVSSENTIMVKARLLSQQMAQNLRESLGADAAVTNGDVGDSRQAQERVSQRDLWTMHGGIERVRMVLLPGAALRSLVDYLDAGDGFIWSNRLNVTQLAQQTQVLLAMPESIWSDQVEMWAQITGIPVTSHLAPKLVADAAVLTEKDELTTSEAAIAR